MFSGTPCRCRLEDYSLKNVLPTVQVVTSIKRNDCRLRQRGISIYNYILIGGGNVRSIRYRLYGNI